ncbi:universal stress protein [Nakamurella antarctica]|nr:universal stress protein [Nakamurella antarctica]
MTLTPSAATRINVIVAGVDGSPESNVAILWAAAQAERRGAELRLVHAYTESAAMYAGPGLIAPSMTEATTEWAMNILASAKELVVAGYPTLAVTAHLHHYDASSSLISEAEHALMMVVGTSHRSRLAELMLGSVVNRVIGNSGCPVVVVRGAENLPADGPVLVALDGSVCSDGALAFAFEEASFRGSELVAVRVWNEPGLERFAGLFPLPIDSASITVDEQVRLAEQLAGWSAKYSDVTVRPLVFGGHPAETLLRESAKTSDRAAASLIVTGSRGRGGFAGLLLGSTSQTLVTHADCPVAVVGLQE